MQNHADESAGRYRAEAAARTPSHATTAVFKVGQKLCVDGYPAEVAKVESHSGYGVAIKVHWPTYNTYSDWILMYNDGQARRVTQITGQQGAVARAAGVAAGAAAGAGQWGQVYSERHNRWYWYNQATDQYSWEYPAGAATTTTTTASAATVAACPTTAAPPSSPDDGSTNADSANDEGERDHDEGKRGDDDGENTESKTESLGEEEPEKKMPESEAEDEREDTAWSEAEGSDCSDAEQQAERSPASASSEAAAPCAKKPKKPKKPKKKKKKKKATMPTTTKQTKKTKKPKQNKKKKTKERIHGKPVRGGASFVTTSECVGRNTWQYSICRTGDDASQEGAVTNAEAFMLLETSEEFRAQLIEQLEEWPTPAVFFECAPARTGDEPFAFVLIDAPQLVGARPNPGPFGAHLRGRKQGAATFPNLGRDAVLVAPRVKAAGDLGAAHLKAFAQNAPRHAQHDLWAAVGTACTRRLAQARDRGGEPFWLSTNGQGVHWLHVRLDDRPKYYRHEPFARDPRPQRRGRPRKRRQQQPQLPQLRPQPQQPQQLQQRMSPGGANRGGRSSGGGFLQSVGNAIGRFFGGGGSTKRVRRGNAGAFEQFEGDPVGVAAGSWRSSYPPSYPPRGGGGGGGRSAVHNNMGVGRGYTGGSRHMGNHHTNYRSLDVHRGGW